MCALLKPKSLECPKLPPRRYPANPSSSQVPPRYCAVAEDATARRTAEARREIPDLMMRPPSGKRRRARARVGLLAGFEAPVQKLLPPVFDVGRIADVAVDEGAVRAQD